MQCNLSLSLSGLYVCGGKDCLVSSVHVTFLLFATFPGNVSYFLSLSFNDSRRFSSTNFAQFTRIIQFNPNSTEMVTLNQNQNKGTQMFRNPNQQSSFTASSCTHAHSLITHLDRSSPPHKNTSFFFAAFFQRNALFDCTVSPHTNFHGSLASPRNRLL